MAEVTLAQVVESKLREFVADELRVVEESAVEAE